MTILPGDGTDATSEDQKQEVDLGYIRPDLEEALQRHHYGFDEARPEAVAKRHKTQHRTVRENLDDLVDPGTLVEYGSLAIAAQRAAVSMISSKTRRVTAWSQASPVLMVICSLRRTLSAS